jgi:hypothetical protein
MISKHNGTTARGYVLCADVAMVVLVHFPAQLRPSVHSQVLGELIDQEGIIVYQGARYKPLPAIAQVRSADCT